MLGSQFALRACREKTTLRLSVAGEFGAAAGSLLQRAFEEALEVPTERVVLDLAAVALLDVAAVRTLLRTYARAREYGVELAVVRPRGTARRVFTLTRVGEMLPLTEDIGASGARALAARPSVI